MKTKHVLIVPEGYEGYIDPMVDEVREDPDVEKPNVKQIQYSDAGEGVLDRNLVTDEKKDTISMAIDDYVTAKDSGDTAAQLDALEIAVTHLWDVVSGDDVGSALTEDSTTTDSTTDDSTSA